MSPQESKAPVARLLSQFSHTNYPYINICDIPDPYEGSSRAEEKRFILAKIHLMDTDAYKILENTHNFEVRFRREYDHVHFGQLQMKDLSDPISVNFSLTAEKSKHMTNVSRLKNCFKRALVGAELDQSQISIRMMRDTRSVLVTANSLADYMTFWQNVPNSGRRLVTNDL